MTPLQPLKVFLSYAHADEAHRKTLAKHLRPLEEEGLITVWHDRMITGGRDWAGVIDDALRSADIVLLLISADFLDSGYCNGVELTEAIRLHNTARVRVVPIILSSCDWEHSRVAHFNALPPNGAPVVEAEYPDQRFVVVARGLRAIVAELTRPGAATPRQNPTPFKIPPPGAKPLLLRLWILVLLTALLGGSVYFFALRSPLAGARDAMREACYDEALNALNTIPAWLHHWPGLAAWRAKASLGARMYASPQAWDSISRDLRRQRADRPTDADLMILEVQFMLRYESADKLRPLIETALQKDKHNVEAWFLLGLERDLSGDTRAAVNYYRKAVDAAPASPHYRNNLARGLLELGQFYNALQEYLKISQFPLARVEQALAHWAKGEIHEAAEAAREALEMLGDDKLSTHCYNRRAWLFRLPNGMWIRLFSPEDKRCYALLGEAASRRLAGDAAVAFPPRECNDPPKEIRELLADDLCRFVDRLQPTLRSTARSLRQGLAMPEDCTGSIQNTTPPGGASKTSL